MSVTLLPLCGIPKIVNRDGYAGPYGRLWLPFYGYLYAGGQTISSNAGTIPQYQGNSVSGTVKPDNYQKAAGICFK